MRAMFRGAYPLVRPTAHAVLSRLMVVQGYLHSEQSGRIRLRLNAPRDGAPSVLRMTGEPGASVRPTLRRLVRTLRRNAMRLRAAPLGTLLKVSEPGRGFHSGGTLPMSANPGRFETDTLGRPNGFERVHVVDSSVFPSITASTITLTVMANAYRIAETVGADA
jgi:choline dehydrogenase-like flavoprotein